MVLILMWPPMIRDAIDRGQERQHLFDTLLLPAPADADVAPSLAGIPWPRLPFSAFHGVSWSIANRSALAFRSADARSLVWNCRRRGWSDSAMGQTGGTG